MPLVFFSPTPKWEDAMEKHRMHYETLLKVTQAISMSKDPEDVVVTTVEAVKTALKAKGAALFLVNKKTNELQLAAANGLSREYRDKGPLSAVKSIAASLEEGPVAIYDVSDDPRIQYPKAAKKEGIASILSVPISIHGQVIGTLRVYTAEPWEFTIEDVNLVQAVAQIAGMALDMARLSRGYKSSIEILKSMRDPKQLKSTKRTPYEGVPVSVPQRQ
jgi:GAF domain-containing protein